MLQGEQGSQRVWFIWHRGVWKRSTPEENGTNQSNRVHRTITCENTLSFRKGQTIKKNSNWQSGKYGISKILCFLLSVFYSHSWTKWRSLNTAGAPKTRSTPSTTPGPAPPSSATTSGATCRWTPPLCSCSSSLRWLRQVQQRTSHPFSPNARMRLDLKSVFLCSRSPYHLHPRRSGCHSESHVLHRGSLQSGCKCPFIHLAHLTFTFWNCSECLFLVWPGTGLWDVGERRQNQPGHHRDQRQLHRHG